MAPAYLKDMLRIQTSDRYKLRSEKSIALIVPEKKFTCNGDRAFCIEPLGSGTNCLLKLQDLKASKLSKEDEKHIYLIVILIMMYFF